MTSTDYTLSRPVAISVPAEDIDRLLQSRDGVCALVYLALQRTGGRPLQAGALGLTEQALTEALQKLASLVLVAGKKAEKPLPPADELPQYTAEDLVRRVREDVTFQSVCAHAEQFFGRKLTTPETQALLGMQDYLGLPVEVLMELITHVFTTYRSEKGPGRNPTMRMVEREAYVWAQNELMTQELAEEYIERQKQRRGDMARLMEALEITGRAPSPSEKKYLSAWLDMGFSADAVAEGYDRTVISAGALKWPYLNKILLSWHEKGLHTLSEIQEGDPRGGGRKQPKTAAATAEPRNDLARAEALLRRRREGKE